MSAQQDLLVDRYGAPAPWKRPALRIGVVLLVLVSGGWLGWTMWEQSSPAVASGELTFTVVDDQTASARFVVDMDDDVVATCTLRAYAEDHTLVGSLSFTPEPTASGRVTQDINTNRRATAVELLGCTAPGQSRPR